MNDVAIKKVSNGFVVQVGCVTAVFGKDEEKEMFSEISNYWIDPTAMEDKYCLDRDPKAMPDRDQSNDC